MNQPEFTRRDLLKTGALAATAAALPTGCANLRTGPSAAPAISLSGAPPPAAERLKFRAVLETINMPYYFADRGEQNKCDEFWDQARWDRLLRDDAEQGYSAVIYWLEPWLIHQWQTWMIPHKEYPEARELTPEQSERVIRHVNWIFDRAHELGMTNFLMAMFVITTPNFARAHGLDQDMPVSETVDWRHNFQHIVPGVNVNPKMIHWGVRNELTRAFSEAAIAELIQTYPHLDGLWGTMGESLPGKRSTWFKEAVLPGLNRSGRKPIFIFFPWMVPIEEAMEDIITPRLYDNMWITVCHNGEIISDTKPYRIALRWAEETGLPVVMQYVALNVDQLPWNSPRFAYKMLKEFKRLDHPIGYVRHLTGEVLSGAEMRNGNTLYSRALGYYGKTDEPYSDEPWVAILEERFGDRAAAQHFLNAYNISAEITPAVNSLAWSPHGGRCPNQLILKYWHWTTDDERFSHFTCDAKGAALLPLRYYAKMVAKLGPAFRDNDGRDYRRKVAQSGPVEHGHPGAQELIWGHIDYQTTPEALMRQVRRHGEECLKEAEAGLKTVKKNEDAATLLFNQMKAYKLLADYYEHKVLTAVAAVVYSHNGDPAEKALAERLGDETVELYAQAANFMYEALDQRSGKLKGGWWDEMRDMPGLIEIEKKDRVGLAKLFNWPEAQSGQAQTPGKAKLATTQ